MEEDALESPPQMRSLPIRQRDENVILDSLRSVSSSPSRQIACSSLKDSLLVGSPALLTGIKELGLEDTWKRLRQAYNDGAEEEELREMERKMVDAVKNKTSGATIYNSDDGYLGWEDDDDIPDFLKPRTEEEARDMKLLQIQDRRTSKHFEALGKKFTRELTTAVDTVISSQRKGDKRVLSGQRDLKQLIAQTSVNQGQKLTITNELQCALIFELTGKQPDEIVTNYRSAQVKGQSLAGSACPADVTCAASSSTISTLDSDSAVSKNEDVPTKNSEPGIGIQPGSRGSESSDALIEKPALQPQTSDSGDYIHSPSPSAKATTESSPEVPAASNSKVAPSFMNTTMPLESIDELNSSELNRKDEAKTVLAGTDSNASTAPSIVSADVAPTVSTPVLKTSVEAEQSVVQPPLSKGGGKGARTSQTIPTIAPTSRKIDKPKTSRNSSMTEAVNRMSKSALRLRQDPSMSSSRSAANPGSPSVLADTSNKSSKQRSSSVTSSAKQRKQPVIQPRENKAAALRAKKNREKVAEQKLKEKMEEMRKKKEQQRKDKEIVRNVEQRWCSGV